MNLYSDLVRGSFNLSDIEGLVAEVYEPRGAFDQPVYIVADVRSKSIRIYHTPSKSDAYTIRDAWRRGFFAVTGEKRMFMA